MCANYVAITLDDLPSQHNESISEQVEINQKILDALKKFNAPATGFVNESKLYIENEFIQQRIAILKMWVDQGFDLGNHTFSHHSLSEVNIEDFKADVLQGAKISKNMMEAAGRPYLYFRHPYLDTGSTSEKRIAFENFLKSENYIISPITIDTFDWKFNDELLKNPEKQKEIIFRYLAYTRAKFSFYRDASIKIFGRNIKHVWLLHVNLLNSLAMEGLLKIAKELGYEFISIEDAMKDSAYQSEDNYYDSSWESWLRRWDSNDNKVDWSKDPQPDCPSPVEAKAPEAE